MITLQENIGTLKKKDLIIATIIAFIMGLFFIYIGGIPLVLTFIPGLIISLGLLYFMYNKNIELPTAKSFVPLFFASFAWQFLHFNEEFVTGFYTQFPNLFGARAYSVERFVTINMISYFAFSVGCVAVFTKRLKFLVLPMLFYIVYGMIGNAITHTWWVIFHKDYFPGFFTAQFYWVLGFIVLSTFLKSKKATFITYGIFAVIVIPLIAFVELYHT
ncbi:hypothetical protein [Arcobacter sp. F2176]|uniref:hypothetical protein n=1 Tax=Arcobacter sp. F2176 TaxID=2044511 RepID=UPI00100AE8F8|nr:hypothetical protein [Arcobacter sp. F2176]RXJ80785.1 hypothetical protein CRU95_10800 [Arcobacter sp. F2176]